MLYTRKGDAGTSGLFGTKERFSKASAVYEALGSIDELNSLLGLCYSMTLRQHRPFPTIPLLIRTVQQHLFIIQAELAGAPKSLAHTHVDELEDMVERFEEKIENPRAFVIPGATELSGLFDYARAVSRRAERAVVRAGSQCKLSSATLAYMNRLSSLLYALARYAATTEGAEEQHPNY
jgi:cob(I)alamin adenosyltransferase